MPDLVVFTAKVRDDEKYPYVSLTARDQKVVRGEKTYSFFQISFAPGFKQFYAEVQYEVQETFKAGTRFARPITSSYGGVDCKARRIPEVLDCLKQKYDIETRVDGATMEVINRVAEREYEDAIAPKPHEIGLFEVMESNSEQVLEAMMKDVQSFCTRASVGKHVGPQGQQYAADKCRTTLEWINENGLGLEIPNDNWDYELEQGTQKRAFNTIIERVREGAEYWVELDWGVLVEEPQRGEKSQAEQIAEKLMSPFKRGERDYLNSIGDETARKLESQRGKDAVRLFLGVYVQSMKKRVAQLR